MLIRDHFSNFKGYHMPKAQLVIADMPYNIGNNAYGSNPQWYIDGDNANGESPLANSKFFQTDENFNSYEFMHFVHKMLKKEPKERGKAPCMIVFCSFEQQFELIQLAKQHNLPNYINLIFRKNYSPQVLKANMRVVGNSEYALLFYRDKLPKFNNNGKMVFNCMDWIGDDIKSPLYRKIHPTQKPVALMKRLIEIFTDPGDVVIDPTAGSGSTLIAAEDLGRKAYGFEIDRKVYPLAKEWIEMRRECRVQTEQNGYSIRLIKSQANQPLLLGY
jgi:site-specific DNA-methyltransferase (adenine-specific)